MPFMVPGWLCAPWNPTKAKARRAAYDIALATGDIPLRTSITIGRSGFSRSDDLKTGIYRSRKRVRLLKFY